MNTDELVEKMRQVLGDALARQIGIGYYYVDSETARAALAVVPLPDAEIEVLRAQVAELTSDKAHLHAIAALHLRTSAETRAKLADCQAFIRQRGHAEDCATRQCGICGTISRVRERHQKFMGHEFHPDICSCGYSQCVEGGE